MKLHNEFGVKPGPYSCRGYNKDDIIVVTELVTHGQLEPLTEALVVFRDLESPVEHINGRPTAIHRRYTMGISKFKELLLVGTIKAL